jgi:hypothetical protein
VKERIGRFQKKLHKTWTALDKDWARTRETFGRWAGHAFGIGGALAGGWFGWQAGFETGRQRVEERLREFAEGIK